MALLGLKSFIGAPACRVEDVRSYSKADIKGLRTIFYLRLDPKVDNRIIFRVLTLRDRLALEWAPRLAGSPLDIRKRMSSLHISVLYLAEKVEKFEAENRVFRSAVEKLITMAMIKHQDHYEILGVNSEAEFKAKISDLAFARKSAMRSYLKIKQVILLRSQIDLVMIAGFDALENEAKILAYWKMIEQQPKNETIHLQVLGKIYNEFVKPLLKFIYQEVFKNEIETLKIQEKIESLQSNLYTHYEYLKYSFSEKILKEESEDEKTKLEYVFLQVATGGPFWIEKLLRIFLKERINYLVENKKGIIKNLMQTRDKREELLFQQVKQEQKEVTEQEEIYKELRLKLFKIYESINPIGLGLAIDRAINGLKVLSFNKVGKYKIAMKYFKWQQGFSFSNCKGFQWQRDFELNYEGVEHCSKFLQNEYWKQDQKMLKVLESLE